MVLEDMQLHIFSVVKRSQNPKNSTYSVWFVRETVSNFKTRLAKGGFLCYNGKKV